MIVKIVKVRAAGSGRTLATYVLGLKHENPGERLGAYVPDDNQNIAEKIEWTRTVNSGADTPAAAISAIEQYNAQNLRRHRVSRWEHVVVSFAEGEKPDRKQMEVIEDRLMAAIGFGDHPRISAVHKPDGAAVANWHLHIAVSRIDPTTLKAEHPRHNHYRLQAEAARLELDLDLKQERKTLLPRERQEINFRVSLEAQRKFDQQALNHFLALASGDLEKLAASDRVPSRWRELKVQDVARELSPEYAALVKQEPRLTGLLTRASAMIDANEAHREDAEREIAAKWKRLGLVRRGLHMVGQGLKIEALRDIDIDQQEGRRHQADWGANRWAVRRREYLDRLGAIDQAFEAIRPAAETELARRQQIARDARQTLDSSLRNVVSLRPEYRPTILRP